jgi:hypothetical protein
MKMTEGGEGIPHF